MKSKPAVPRALASLDIDQAIAYYLAENAEQAAIGFIDVLEEAFTHIGRNPATGSPRYAHELNIPSLRSWPLSRHPFLIFYVERDERIDVWRVLHMRRELPDWLQAPELE